MAPPSRPLPPSPTGLQGVLFRALALLLPVVAVLLVEGALRTGGVGAERRAPFVPVPGHPEAVALAPEFGASFFRGFQPGVAFDPLDAERDPATLRVVAMGGSSTAGFPYHAAYAFPARLEDRLAAQLPGRRVEVANLGMTATNSFTVWALAEPVARLRPDAVVIYAGHNEYYGAYGSGGTEGWTGTSVPLRRLGVRASRWAVVTALAGLGTPPLAAESRTLMARVVRDAEIDAGGEVYRAGVAQFEANLRDVLRTFERAGIPVYLATIASNLAGQPPLGDAPEAAQAFAAGRRALAAGDSVAARAAFLRAKEADGLRFRAPEAINGVIRALAAEFPTVTLVDAAGRFRRASPGGIEGAALFTDHLHPNARGYALLADAFSDALRATHPAFRGATAPGPSPTDLDPVEAAFADLQLTALTSGYPFRKDRTPAQASDAARARAQALVAGGGYGALGARVATGEVAIPIALAEGLGAARAARDTVAALRLYRALLPWRPFDPAFAEQAVGYALASPAYDDETAALARTAANHAAPAYGRNVLAAIALRSGDLARAERLLVAAEATADPSPEVLFNRARLLVLQGDTLGARAYFERYQAARR